MAQYRVTFSGTEYPSNIANNAMEGMTLSASYRVTADGEEAAVFETSKKYDLQHKEQRWYQLEHTVVKLRD